MLTTPSPHDSIERFAELSARLGDPFADRQAVLRAAGLDEERWNGIAEHWSTRLAAPEGEALVERFGDAYAAAMRHQLAPVRDTAFEPTGQRFLSTTAQPWRAEAASVGMGLSSSPSAVSRSADTVDTDWRAPRAAMPVGSPPSNQIYSRPAEPLPSSPIADVDMTLPVSARLLIPVSAAMPFVPPQSGEVYVPPAPPPPPLPLEDVDMTLPVSASLRAPVLPFSQADTTQPDRDAEPPRFSYEPKPRR